MVVSDNICGHDLERGDQIWIFNCEFDQFDYYKVTGDGLQYTHFDWDGSSRQIVDSFTIPAGAGFAFTTGADEGDVSLTKSGEVAPSGTQRQTFQYSYDETTEKEEFMFLLVNPFPIDTTLADIASFATERGDQIKVFNPEFDQEDFYKLTSDGWQKTAFNWDGSVRAIIPVADYENVVVIPAGSFGNFTPDDTDKEYIWDVTFNY